MDKKLPVEAVPISDEPSPGEWALVRYCKNKFEQDNPLIAESERQGRACTAFMYKGATDWITSSLEIRWKSEERAFTVAFKGNAKAISLPVQEILSKRVPLQIAQSSGCECGASLELGDYEVSVEDTGEESDFWFRANYFCPRCKTKAVAEKKGLKRLIEDWIFGLKKIEIKATGVGIERSDQRGD
jgi:hypothetical protein